MNLKLMHIGEDATADWYGHNPKAAPVVKSLEQVLAEHGFTLKRSGEGSITVDGTRLSGVCGTYLKNSGQFSRELVDIFVGSRQDTQKQPGTYYAVACARTYGFPLFSFLLQTGTWIGAGQYTRCTFEDAGGVFDNQPALRRFAEELLRTAGVR